MVLTETSLGAKKVFGRCIIVGIGQLLNVLKIKIQLSFQFYLRLGALEYVFTSCHEWVRYLYPNKMCIVLFTIFTNGYWDIDKKFSIAGPCVLIINEIHKH